MWSINEERRGVSAVWRCDFFVPLRQHLWQVATSLEIKLETMCSAGTFGARFGDWHLCFRWTVGYRLDQPTHLYINSLWPFWMPKRGVFVQIRATTEMASRYIKCRVMKGRQPSSLSADTWACTSGYKFNLPALSRWILKWPMKILYILLTHYTQWVSHVETLIASVWSTCEINGIIEMRSIVKPNTLS